MRTPRLGLIAVFYCLLLAACGSEAWEQDAAVQTAKKTCKGLDEGDHYACVERHAVETLNPDVCRLAGIWIDDMCLQAVYEAAGDPAICDQLYLEGVRPTCRAYYLPHSAVPITLTEENTAMAPGTTRPPTSPASPIPPTRVAATRTWHSILFSYNHAGATELWAVDPASGTAQRQIRPEQTVQDPAVSPSGETIAYVRVTGDYGGVVSELWLMDRDGANPRLLYVPPAGRSVLSRPAWQPDGQEITFLQLGSGANSQLLRIPVIGGEPTVVLTDCLDFALSPNGEWLVNVNLGRQLTVSKRDGTRLRDIEPQGARFTDYYSLAASPHGDLLAFQGTEQGEDTWNLYVMDWSGLDVHRLTDLSGFHPFTRSSGQVNGLAWTSDGSRLVYSVDGHPEQLGIWVIDAEGGEPRRLFAWEEAWAAVQGPWFGRCRE